MVNKSLHCFLKGFATDSGISKLLSLRQSSIGVSMRELGRLRLRRSKAPYLLMLFIVGSPFGAFSLASTLKSRITSSLARTTTGEVVSGINFRRGSTPTKLVARRCNLYNQVHPEGVFNFSKCGLIRPLLMGQPSSALMNQCTQAETIDFYERVCRDDMDCLVCFSGEGCIVSPDELQYCCAAACLTHHGETEKSHLAG